VTLPLVASLARLAPAKLAFTVGASAGSRRDRDRVRLACLPSPAAPSLARTIQPILSARCASSAACHQGPTPAAEPALDPGVSRAGLVGVASLNVPGLDRVQPGSIKRSYLARKVLGRSIPDRSARMPLGCSDVSAPPGGCLTEPETAAILGWIAAGAPDN
jgi:hypothetical protein